MEKRELTAADVWAMFAETDRKKQELDRQIAEGHRILDEKLAENNRFLIENFAETSNKTFAEIRKMFEESRAERQENDRKLTEKFEALGIKVKDVNSNVVGIGNSNGEYAEEYFYNSLEKKMEFAGVHFDDISTAFKLLKKASDGKRIEDQFDIVMLNGEAAAIIEIKYKARKGDPKQMVSQKISNFRFLFPDYAKLKIYLGLAAFTFEESAVKEAKELGIGLLKQVGETIEYETKWVRAY